MTWKVTNAAAQHGGACGPTRRLPGVLTFHFGPATPLWCVVKAVVWVTTVTSTVPRVRRTARWTTVMVVTSGGRWCDQMAAPHLAAAAGLITEVTQIGRPVGYDFARWRWPARVTVVPADESWLVRPKHV